MKRDASFYISYLGKKRAECKQNGGKAKKKS